MFDIDVSQALVNASRAFESLRSLIFVIALLVGVVIFIKGIKYCIVISNTNGPGIVSPSKAIWHLIFGALFAAFSFTISAPWNTFATTEANTSIVAYNMPGTDGVPEIYKEVIVAALKFIQLVGYCFAFHGMLLAMRAFSGESNGSGESPTMSAFWRFMGGLGCINVGPFLLGVSALITGAS